MNALINKEHWHHKANISLCVPLHYNPTPNVKLFMGLCRLQKALYDFKSVVKYFQEAYIKGISSCDGLCCLWKSAKCKIKDACFFTLSNKNNLNACGCMADWDFWIKAYSDAWTCFWRPTKCNQRKQECIFKKNKNDHPNAEATPWNNTMQMNQQ